MGSRFNPGAAPATVMEFKRGKQPLEHILEGAATVPQGTVPKPGNQP